MDNQHIYIEGKKIADIKEIPPRGIFYGEGVFETMRWKERPPVFLDRHINRLLRGVSFLKMPEPDGEKIITEITQAVKKTGFADCAVKVCVVSGGSSAPFFVKPDSFKTIISVRKISRDLSRQDIKIVCHRERYSRGNSPLSKIKSLNYLENIIAMRDARERGFDDALFLDTKGFVSETSCRNIFWGTGRQIKTPSSDCGLLPGITRGVLMEVARQNGFTVSETACPPEEIAQSDFVFVTNSLEGIVRVDKIEVQDLTLTFNTSDVDSYLNLKTLLYQALQW